MKKLLLLFALAVVITSSAFAQEVTRRVLVEEFTNTGCPPCAATDPIVESFEAGYLDKVCFLKYHVSWPDPQDPFYVDQKATNEANNRGQSYYGVTGVPHLQFGGTTVQYPNSEAVMEGVVDDIAALMSPFTIDVTQAIEGDSVVATITVKAVAAVPTGDLRLMTAFAERFNPYLGTNGRPFHTSIVRKVVPGYETSGAPKATAAYPALTIANGETKSFRYAAKIGPTWNRNMLMAVVFIQDVDSKEVYQANWTVPAVSIGAENLGVFTIVPTPIAPEMTLTNKSSVAQNIKVDFLSPDKPADWSFKITGASDQNVVTIPAGESKTISVEITTGADESGSASGAFMVSSAEGLGIGGATSSFFGNGNTSVIVDAGAGTAGMAGVLEVMRAKGMKAGVAARVPFSDYFFEDWSKFKTVIWAAGNSTGLYSNTGDWEKLEAHLANGGNFLMTGSLTPGVYFRSGDESLMDLWRTHFHIEPVNYSQTTWGTINGVAGDPVGDGLTGITLPVKEAIRQPLKPADGEFRSMLTSEKRDTVGSRALSGTGKVVYLSAGLDKLAPADRETIEGRIIDWFNGSASIKTGDVATTAAVSNYPNPAVKTATFAYSIAEPGVVSLAVYDIMGHEVARVLDAEMHTTGTYEADLDASKLANGSYTYVLTTGGQQVSGTLIVQK